MCKGRLILKKIRENKMIQQVKVFNQLAIKRYEKTLEEWKQGNRQYIPFKPMFTFNLPNGQLRKRGYVVSQGHSHRFYLTRAKLLQANI